jgi:hypothetical protein
MRPVRIGEFARLSRLSPKALRRYDEPGLLRPARVDQYSGYRRYEAGQLDRARRVAWLRQTGMPLAPDRRSPVPDRDAGAGGLGGRVIQIGPDIVAP